MTWGQRNRPERPDRPDRDRGAPPDRIAVVTGANRGIGREVTRQLAGRGFTVVLGARNLKDGQRVARAIDPGGEKVIAARLDVTDVDTISALGHDLNTRFGRLDVLVNNAGIAYDTWETATTADLRTVLDALDVNLLGAWRTVRELAPQLTASAHPRVVNVSSEAGSISEMTGGPPAYSVSKAALNALTRLLAAELHPKGVLVNAVCPGWTDTDMGQGGRPVADGAAGIVWAATLPDDGPTGGFFRDGRPLPW